jgi:hypothetical protein
MRIWLSVLLITFSIALPLNARDIHAEITKTHHSRTIMFEKDQELYRALILSADEKSNTVQENELLQEARTVVFNNFKTANPEYTQEQWDRVAELDPLYDIATRVIIIQSLETGEIVGNLKMVYDHPSRPLPAERRFKDAYQRPPAQIKPVNFFNIISGQHSFYQNSHTGGAIQIMEFYGPRFSSALMFMANMVLVEHPFVTIPHPKGRPWEMYPAEIIAYGDKSEMGGYHQKIGLTQIAEDNGYLLHKMSIDHFKQAYRSNFVYRPAARLLNKYGLLYQLADNPLLYLHIDDVFSKYTKSSIYRNFQRAAEVYSELREYLPKYFLQPDLRLDTMDANLIHTHKYLEWAIKATNTCHVFYDVK